MVHESGLMICVIGLSFAAMKSAKLAVALALIISLGSALVRVQFMGIQLDREEMVPALWCHDVCRKSGFRRGRFGYIESIECFLVL